MGAGQIGGIATLVDIDFQNAVNFVGQKASVMEAQYIVFYLSHSMLFCTGVLIEAHVALTVASCVVGERQKFNLVGGTHRFHESAGVTRQVDHLCLHRGYNHTERIWQTCRKSDNLALMILDKQFSFGRREPGSDYVINRVRYGGVRWGTRKLNSGWLTQDRKCNIYGWGSRRNGFLIPLLLDLYRIDVTILDHSQCLAMFNEEKKYLCIEEKQCLSPKYGALCPDDLGSVLVCDGFAYGIMTSRLIDRPCGVGYLDLNLFTKFLTCGVDDVSDLIEGGDEPSHVRAQPKPSLQSRSTKEEIIY